MDVMELLEEPRLVRHRLTVDDYHRMSETGVLGPEARVELIEGEVIEMAPTGTKHFATVSQLDYLLKAATASRAIVTVQSPLQLNRFNAPQPDLAVLKPRADFYASALPTGADALLIIEVAHTTAAYDVRTKAPLYARHGVPEYWVVDLDSGLLRRFRNPQGGSWLDMTATAQPGTVQLPGLDGAQIDLSPLF